MFCPACRSPGIGLPVLLLVASSACETSGERLPRIHTHPQLTTPAPGPVKGTARTVDGTTADETSDRAPAPTNPSAAPISAVVSREQAIVTLATGIVVGSSWHEIAGSRQARQDSTVRPPPPQIVRKRRPIEAVPVVEKSVVEEPSDVDPHGDDLDESDLDESDLDDLDDL